MVEIRELLNKLPWQPEPLYAASSASGFSNPVGGQWVDLGIAKYAAAHNQMPPWWSPSRDVQLRQLWVEDDHLAGAVYAMQAKMTAIPFRVMPRNTHIKLHMRQAEQYERWLYENSDLTQGWLSAYGKFIIDLHTQDNGAFMLVLGGGRADGPIIGPAFGLVHLDSGKCIRTGDAEYPVVYMHDSGSLKKIHYTRVIYISQMPSPERNMNGVGYCAVTRALRSAERLIDIANYASEKMGSRPLRAILTVDGMSGDSLKEALQAAAMEMDNEGYGVFSKFVALASLDGKINANLIDLAKLPDGFNEEITTRMAMYTIALAFGVDARELFPASEAGATKADATVQHQKARGKAPGHIMQLVTNEINKKVLPEHLEFIFDFQDDEQDMFRAEIKEKRAAARVLDLTAGITDIRTDRERALMDEDITQAQFDRMELADGRLPDGTSVLALFFSLDPEIKAYLDLGIANPLVVDKNNPTTIIPAIEKQEQVINTDLVNTSNPDKKQKAQQALAALKALRFHYAPEELTPLQPPDGKQMLGPVNTPLLEAGETEDSGLEGGTTGESAGAKGGNRDRDGDGETQEKQFSDFKKSVYLHFDRFIRGDITREDFISRMQETVERGYEDAFAFATRGLDTVSGVPGYVKELITSAKSKITALADSLLANPPQSLEQLNARADLWVNGYNYVKGVSQVREAPDEEWEWVYSPFVENHCSQCKGLNGQIKTGKEWQEAGIFPQSHDLECGGWHCGCKFRKHSSVRM